MFLHAPLFHVRWGNDGGNEEKRQWEHAEMRLDQAWTWGGRILIFKQLFFLYFTAITEQKSVHHYKCLGAKNSKEGWAKIAPKRSSSSTDSSFFTSLYSPISPLTALHLPVHPHPSFPSTFIFVLLCYTVFPLPPPAYISCPALVFTPRYLFLYLHLFALIVSSFPQWSSFPQCHWRS